MTTAAPETTCGRSGWIRTLVVTVGIALLVLTLMPPAVRAETSEGVRDNTLWQVALCEAGGGKATVTTAERTVSGGLLSTTVECHGGILDGVHCYNSSLGTLCNGGTAGSVSPEPGSQTWPLEEILPVLENGSPEQINDILTDLEGANEPEPGASPSVVSPDDQHQDQDTHHSKHKKGKHGKKGGTGRK